MSKVRYQMFLDEGQKETLKRLQRDYKIPAAEIIRKALDEFLVKYKKEKILPIGDSMTKKLLSVAGVCKGGPKDLADRHDKYLYGVSK